MQAVRNNNPEIVAALLAVEAAVNIMDENGSTPLLEAIMCILTILNNF